MRIPRGVRIGRHGPMVNSIARRRARNGVAGPTSIELSALSFDEDAEAGSTVATITAESDTPDATYTFALLDDADGLFEVEGNLLKLATTLPSGEEIFLRDVTIQGTIDQTGGSSSETFTLTITPVDTSNDSGLEDDAGSIVAVGEFTLAPTVGGNNGALKFKGKSGGLAYYVFDIGTAEAGGIYTYSYVPYFSELSNQGRNAFVGFGFKEGNSFHLTGLKGDGSTGLTKHKINGTGIGPSDYTSTASGAPENGTQSGPNFVQIEISEDGESYTFRTSGDSGETWDDEFTASAPSPFADATTPTTFGLAVFLENSDKGRFSLDVTEWSVAGLAATDPNIANVVLLAGFEGPSSVFTWEAPTTSPGFFTEGGVSRDTTTKKFGTSSMAVDGTSGAHIRVNDSNDWTFPGEVTVETFVRFDALTPNGSTRGIVGQWNTSSNQRSWQLLTVTPSGQPTRLRLFYASSPSTGLTLDATGGDLATDTWYHVAFDRDASGNLRLYLDGVMVAKTTFSAAFASSTAQLYIGNTNGGTSFDGNIDEVRITKGVARYASDDGFAVPTEAFPRA